MNENREMFALPTACSLLTFCVMFSGTIIYSRPAPRPAQLDSSNADRAVLVRRAGLGNERWSVTLAMNKHESHLHEAGDCKISKSKL